VTARTAYHHCINVGDRCIRLLDPFCWWSRYSCYCCCFT